MYYHKSLFICAQDTLLHLAAKTKGMVVLPLVSEEYKRLKVFPDAMLKLNKANRSPLHMAIAASLYDNVILLFKDCMDLCPKALEPLGSGKKCMSAVYHIQNHCLYYNYGSVVITFGTDVLSGDLLAMC